MQTIGLLLAVATVFGYVGSAEAATSVTHEGLTWTFSSDRPTGTFVNGEPWVLGPVTVTNISPGWTGSQNGSMKNPVPFSRVPGQGFTTGLSGGQLGYDSSKNVGANLPVALAGGDCLVTLETAYDDSTRVWGQKGWVLTVVSQTPAAGSFRPPPYGGGADRSVKFNVSQMELGFLPQLGRISSTPSATYIRGIMPSLPWFEVSGSYVGGNLGPQIQNCAAPRGSSWSNYGREIASKWGVVGLWLCTAQSEVDQRAVAIATIQAGIDILGYIEAGGLFYPDGGHKCGRKFPVVFAAAALRVPELEALAREPNVFQEDAQIWTVSKSDVGRAVDAPSVGYSSEHVGLPEWGIRHAYEPNKDDSRWSGGTPYRHTVWPNMIGPSFAAELMGLKDLWNHPSIFAYNVRYADLSGLPSGFAGDMWRAYKTSTPPATTPPNAASNLSISP